MAWLVVGYYTEGTRYVNHAQKLIQSLEDLNLSYEVAAVKNLGSWDANTHYKPIFLKEMVKKHYGSSLVYVDVDAVFLKYPTLFDKLDADKNVKIAVHILDHQKYRRKGAGKELLSGTIFLRACDEVSIIIDEWIAVCKSNLKLWDQVALGRVLRGKNRAFHVLPPEYCMIFDYMTDVKEPVIKHFQASREERRRAQLQKKLENQPRRVVENGVIKIRRTNVY